jgi:hypothetical protein
LRRRLASAAQTTHPEAERLGRFGSKKDRGRQTLPNVVVLWIFQQYLEIFFERVFRFAALQQLFGAGNPAHNLGPLGWISHER